MSPWVPEDHVAAGFWAWNPLAQGPREPRGEGAGYLGQNRPSEGQPPREGREVGTGQGFLLSAGSQDPERAEEVGRQVGETPSAGHWWRAELERNSVLSLGLVPGRL